MIYVPKPHQASAIRRLLDSPLCSLFALPGSGKTSIILSVLKITGARALIIAPLQTVLSSWPGELAKWDQFKNMDVATAHGKNKESAFDHQIVLINPDGLKWLYDNKKLLKHFDTLIVDESTMFKNWTAKRTKILKKLLPAFDRRHIMTGTPTPRSLIVWFSQQFIVDRGASFGSYITHFKKTWFKNVGYKFPDWQPLKHTPEHLADVAAPFVHIVDDEDLAIPDAHTVDLSIDLPADIQKEYKSMERRLVADVLGSERIADSAGVAYGYCRQIAAGGLYDEGADGYSVLHDTKTSRVVQLIDELQGAPLLVFYQYRFESDLLSKKLGYQLPEISGRTPVKKRGHVIDKWNRGETPVLMIQSQSGAHGLNLHEGGRHMVWLTISDDPEIYEQANCRLRRLGVTNTVMVYRIIVNDTVESGLIAPRLASSANSQQALIDYCKKIQKDR